MHATSGLLQAVGVGFVLISVVIVAMLVVSLVLGVIKIVKEYERDARCLKHLQRGEFSWLHLRNWYLGA